MFAILMLLAVPALASVAPSAGPQEPAPAGEFEQKLADAGDDVAKLMELAAWCDAAGLVSERKTALVKVIEIDPDHEEARKGLRHHAYDGKWFSTYIELSNYKREEAKRMLEEHGLVRFGEEWVPEGDIAYLRMSWVKDDAGKWVSPTELERKKTDAQRAAEGWERQDLTWIPPDESEELAKGLFKCGDSWLPLEEANGYHAQIGQWWELPGQHFVAYTTVPRRATLEEQGADWTQWYCDQTYPDLVRAYGVEPRTAPVVIVLNGISQYNTFAAGDPSRGLPATEAEGFSSVHYAYFAEALFDVRTTPPEYRGSGVAYWDVADPKLVGWGVHSIRHAAALSYAEAIDPSWDTVSRAAAGGAPLSTASFWAEKRIPRWLRRGVASYCELFFSDPSAGDPLWARNWGLERVRAGGLAETLDPIFALALDPAQPEASAKLLLDAGLLVHWILDGDDPAVRGAHEAFKEALRTGADTAPAVASLQAALSASQGAMRAFAGL